MLLDGAFTALLLLCGVSAVTVPPPTDVTVTCDNLKTTVTWKYSEQPQTSFRVHMEGSDGKHYENYTTEHQSDLSQFVWESQDHYMGFHYVTVTAIQGRNQSEPVNSNTFTFNRLKTASLTCRLAFPPHVQLTMGDSGATVSFPNPLHVYKELKQDTNQDGASFEFSVCTESKTFDASCTVKENICRHSFSFPEGVEQYVTLKGKLCSRDCLGQVEFIETERIYPSDSSKVLVVTLSLMLGILVFIIIVVTFIICKGKEKQQKSPSCLEMNGPYGHLPLYPGPEEETAVMMVINFRRPSVSSEEDVDPTSLSSLCPPQAGHNSSMSSVEGYKEGGLSDSEQDLASGERSTDDDSMLNSEDTEWVSMNSNSEGARNDHYDSVRFPFGLEGTKD